MTGVVIRPILWVALAVTSQIASNSVAAETVGDHQRMRMTMESENPRTTVTAKYMEIMFSKEPESRFFVHGTDRFIAVAQPGKKTVAPSIDQVDHIGFVEADRLLVVEWRMSDGATERATFRGMDRATWERLKGFVAKKLGPSLEMRE
jgi:hypothetical protein